MTGELEFAFFHWSQGKQFASHPNKRDADSVPYNCFQSSDDETELDPPSPRLRRDRPAFVALRRGKQREDLQPRRKAELDRYGNRLFSLAHVENIRRAYQHAIEARYRFFSYGDAMLIEKQEKI